MTFPLLADVTIKTRETFETGSTGSTGDENAPSFTTREEYNKILKDMGFNRTRI